MRKSENRVPLLTAAEIKDLLREMARYADDHREKYLTAGEVAKMLKVKPTTVYRWAYRGLVPHVKIEGTETLRFKESSIKKWVDDHEKRGKESQT